MRDKSPSYFQPQHQIAVPNQWWNTTCKLCGTTGGGLAPNWKSCKDGPLHGVFLRKLRSVNGPGTWWPLLPTPSKRSRILWYQLIPLLRLGKSAEMMWWSFRISAIRSGSYSGTDIKSVVLATLRKWSASGLKDPGTTSNGGWDNDVDDIDAFTKQKISCVASAGDRNRRGTRSSFERSWASSGMPAMHELWRKHRLTRNVYILYYIEIQKCKQYTQRSISLNVWQM